MCWAPQDCEGQAGRVLVDEKGSCVDDAGVLWSGGGVTDGFWLDIAFDDPAADELCTRAEDELCTPGEVEPAPPLEVEEIPWEDEAAGLLLLAADDAPLPDCDVTAAELLDVRPGVCWELVWLLPAPVEDDPGALETEPPFEETAMGDEADRAVLDVPIFVLEPDGCILDALGANTERSTAALVPCPGELPRYSLLR